MPRAKPGRRANRRRAKPAPTILEDAEPEIRVIVPEEQLKDLTERQLKEEKSICLDSMNPELPQKLIFFHCNKNEYVDVDKEFSQLIVHFELESQLVHEKRDEEEVQEVVPEVKEETEEAGDEKAETKEVAVETKHVSSKTVEQPPKKTKLRNQFKYSERGCQTFNHPTRDRAISTVPPNMKRFTAQASRHAIFDTYLADFLAKTDVPNKAKDSKKGSHAVEHSSAIQTFHSDALKNAVRLMEHVVHHNAEYDIYHDFQFWTGDGKPELNHLWRIKGSDRRCVTSIQLNKKFPELFAIGYGSYNFMKPRPGRISIFSMKNPLNPHFSFDTVSGIMAMDFSEDHPSLLCVGFYDGSVAVYDIKNHFCPLLYKVDTPEQNHKDPVWEVRWLKDRDAFLSISTDGAMVTWILSKNELIKEPLLTLQRNDTLQADGGLLRKAQATTFDLNPIDSMQCLVGTEFGEIMLYDLNDEHQAPKKFEGHESQVYAVRWSPFSSSTFLSASEDWTLKLWDVHQEHPIITYDLVAPVGDVCWSNFSSTSFSAVTTDNKVHVFDLAVNRDDASIHHKINLKSYGLTHLACAADRPTIIVSDRHGVLDIFKIPEYLTKHAETREEEVARLEAKLKITGTNVLDLKLIQPPATLDC